jgi:hypothetical protein
MNMKVNNKVVSAVNTFTIKGTAKELQAKGVKINGVAVNDPALSILRNMRMVSICGTINKPKGQRGRASSVFELTSRPGFNVTY